MALDLQYLGGKTLPQLAFRLVYLGRWSAADRRALDASLPAAMSDRGLNDVVAQYFPGQTIGSTFTGSTARKDAVSTRVDKPEVESLEIGIRLTTVLGCHYQFRSIYQMDGSAQFPRIGPRNNETPHVAFAGLTCLPPPGETATPSRG